MESMLNDGHIMIGEIRTALANLRHLFHGHDTNIPLKGMACNTEIRVFLYDSSGMSRRLNHWILPVFLDLIVKSEFAQKR